MQGDFDFQIGVDAYGYIDFQTLLDGCETHEQKVKRCAGWQHAELLTRKLAERRRGLAERAFLDGVADRAEAALDATDQQSAPSMAALAVVAFLVFACGVIGVALEVVNARDFSRPAHADSVAGHP